MGPGRKAEILIIASFCLILIGIFNLKSFDTYESGILEERYLQTDKFVIIVFAWKRLASLKRLCESLLKADYYGRQVDIQFNVDGEYTDNVKYYVEKFEWPNGNVRKIYHRNHLGLEQNIMTSWYPAYKNEYAIFLEDDIEVSRYFFKWMLVMLENYKKEQLFTRNIIGISLYTPRINEVTANFVMIDFKQMLPNNDAFLFQLPCSWGALYFPDNWHEFRKYYVERKLQKISQSVVPNSRSSYWERSWKKYLIEWMYLKGQVMVYPNFFNQTSFSTTYVEPGEHTAYGGSSEEVSENRMRTDINSDYTVPLLSEDFDTKSFAISKLPIINVYHSLTNSIIELVLKGLIRYDYIRMQTVNFPDISPKHCILDSFHELDDHPRAPPKYLIFQQQFGFSNQMQAIEDAICISFILDRHLIIPPFITEDKNYLKISSVFNITGFHNNGFKQNILFLENYSEKNETIIPSRILKPKGLVKHSIAQETLFSSLGWHDVPRVEIPMNSQMDYDIYRLFSDCNDNIMAIDSMFSLFSGFYEPKYEEVKNQVTDNLWRLNNYYQNKVEDTVRYLDNYGCIHVRRGDFIEYCTNLENESQSSSPRPWLKMFKKEYCYQADKSIIEEINEAVETYKIRTIYISTNEKTLISSLQLQISPDIQLFDGNIISFSESDARQVLPFLEQAICIKANFFIGNFYSTFSQRIARHRSSNTKMFGK